MFLNPLNKNELKEIFDEKSQEILKYYIRKAIYFHPEVLPNQDIIPLQVTKEYLEQWLVQSLGAKPIGSGSYPVDIIHDEGWASDIKMLAWNKSKPLSGETSLAQKFTGIGANLDIMFGDKHFNKILIGWKEILSEKYEEVFTDNENVKNIYYFIILRESYNFHLIGLKLKFEDLYLASPGEYTEKNLTINNFINNDLGNIRIYKSKKRMELRIIPKEWEKRDLMISFNNNNNPNKSCLRDKTSEELYYDNLLDFKKIFQEK